MVEEPGRDISGRESVMRSSNRPEPMSLLVQVTTNPSKNATFSRKRVNHCVFVGHVHQLSMSMKAPRAKSQNTEAQIEKNTFGVMGFELLSFRVSVDLIRH